MVSDKVQFEYVSTFAFHRTVLNNCNDYLLSVSELT
jgi:hypothetical protein